MNVWQMEYANYFNVITLSIGKYSTIWKSILVT